MHTPRSQWTVLESERAAEYQTSLQEALGSMLQAKGWTIQVCPQSKAWEKSNWEKAKNTSMPVTVVYRMPSTPWIGIEGLDGDEHRVDVVFSEDTQFSSINQRLISEPSDANYEQKCAFHLAKTIKDFIDEHEDEGEADDPEVTNLSAHTRKSLGETIRDSAIRIGLPQFSIEFLRPGTLTKRQRFREFMG